MDFFLQSGKTFYERYLILFSTVADCHLTIFKIAIKARRFADDNAVLTSVEEWFNTCYQRLSSKHRFIIFSNNKTIGLTNLVIMCNVLCLQIIIVDFFLYKLINSLNVPLKVVCLRHAFIFTVGRKIENLR